MDEWKQLEDFKREMNMIFELALNKAVDRRNKEGNKIKPYKDFNEDHLKDRLDDEYNEFLEEGKARELLDVINMAAFLYLRMTVYNEEKLELVQSGIVDLEGR